MRLPCPWQYFPDLGFVGNDSFDFFASDSIEDGDIATIHLDVAPDYNAGPLVANDDVTFTERGTPVNIAVLNNDGSNQGMLEITAVTQGAHGTVWTDTVEIAYTPTDPLFTGKDTFQYKVEDGTGAYLWASVDVYMYKVDIDVTNDGDLLDPEDGTDNYLPGYVGEDDVLSTGTEFADWQYLGQQMRVIVEGIGSDAGVNQVVFQLQGVTNYDGYSENTSDPAIEGSDKNKDFAFAQGANQSLFVATGANIEPTQSWAPLWAKDYGADANIQVSFQVGTVAESKTIAAFKDTDNDKLPDKWENLKVSEYDQQYGTSFWPSLTLFDAGYDDERQDIDLNGAFFDSAPANSDIYIFDIRPPGSAGTVSVQFVNGVASSGLTISKTTSGNDTTITVELADNGTNITSTANDVVSALNGNTTVNNIVSAEVWGSTSTGHGIVDAIAPTPLGPLPPHKSKGDSLKVLQEWRGFVLDGTDPGIVGAPPLHVQLSPVRKELLVEVDIMTGVTNMPTPAEISSIMQSVADGFADPADGAGINVYWVIDQKSAGPQKVFSSWDERKTWATGTNRNPKLKEFVHLMFADHISDAPLSHGVSSTYGSYVSITPIKADATLKGWDFHKSLSSTAAHELTHLLLDTYNANGFVFGEHVTNGDTSDPDDSANDKKYLMYPKKTAGRMSKILFSNQTMSQIDLKSKESVERTP